MGDAHIAELMRQRHYWVTQNSNATLPTVTLLVGIAMIAGGGALFAYTEDHAYDCGEFYNNSSGGGTPCQETRRTYATAGITLLSVGVAAVGGSFALFSFLTGNGRKEREIGLIDQKLKSFGLEASLAPWYTRSSASPRGTGGFATSIRF